MAPWLDAAANWRNAVGVNCEARHDMTIRVSGKRISVGEALRERVSARTEDVLRKYFDGNYSGHFTFSKDGFGFRTDCALHLDSGITLEADASAADAYASADLALAQIEKRLRRYKSRLKDRSARMAHVASAVMARRGGADIAGDVATIGAAGDEFALDAQSYVIEAPPLESEDEVTAFNPVVIAEATTSLKRMSVSEAVMELDLTGAAAMVFQHGGSGRVNMIYRRPDGNIGWIDPPNVNPSEHH
jgi:ribosomal subunit interface protein